MDNWPGSNGVEDRWSPTAIVDWLRWVGIRRILGALAILVAVGVTAWWLLRPAPPVADSAIPTLPIELATAEVSTPSSRILIHVTGAVEVPGVVEVDAAARIRDVIAAAGGALGRADLDAVNLAAPVLDGAQIHVPAVGEIVEVSLGVQSATSAVTRVNINTADVASLDSLPGIGPSTAAAIVERRTEVGRFVAVDDLLEVPGIGPAKVDALRDLVVLS